jgi:hypothetical protein
LNGKQTTGANAMINKIIEHENAAVVINVQKNDNGGSDYVWANLYVNTRGKVSGNRLLDGVITLRRWDGRTIKGAEKWAKKVLEIN